MQPERRAYLIASSPGWILIGLAAVIATRVFNVSAPLAIAIVGLWIAKDLLAYPMMRQYYRSMPSEQRIVGAAGVALSALAPRGFVRVGGEIWQAEVAAEIGTVAEGSHVRVREIQGLLLLVEPA
jgi:membrane protein implicated in regulation of membrane protease activity